MITGKYLENPALYSPDELERLDNHIEKYFGKATTVVHEFFSEDIHVDVSIIPPHEEHNYYTLVTTGMGAFSMKIPSEYQEDGLPSRIELMMCLPPEWNPESKESQENWPVELLRYLARFPIIESTWLGYGHSIQNGTPYADNTLLAGCVLLGVQDAPEGAAVCKLSDGSWVGFYQVIPLTENDLMSAEFMERYWEQVQPFMADLSRADLRGFIRDQLKGQLFGALFNKEGAAFAGYYYGEADSPYFPSDIDNYALEYFGSEQYYSDKFQDEAYLFIPFDENYYQAMAKVMEKRFANWQGQSFDEATLEPSDLAEAMMEYLDCECTYFPSMTDDDPIMSAYNYAKRESVKEGFVPVLIKADDEILWECLIMNSDPDSDGEDDFAFDPDKVAEYRKKMLSAPVENSKAVLEEMIGQRKEEAEDDDMDWDEEILGEMEGGYDNRRFSSYWNSDNNMRGTSPHGNKSLLFPFQTPCRTESSKTIAPVYICLQIKLYNFSKTWSRTQKSLKIWRGFGAMDRLLC